MKLLSVTFDCADAAKLSEFWATVLERTPAEGANEHFALLPGDPNLLFLQVPEGRVAKNRVHLDLAFDDLPAARQQLEGLGATFVHEKQEFGVHWMTFQDPEQNEFCVGHHG